MRVAVPAQATSPYRDHQLRHRVAGAGVEALDDRDPADDRVGRPVGVAGDDEVDRRVLELADDADDRALPRGRGAVVDAVGAEHGALVDHDDLHLDAAAAQLARLALDALGLVEEREARGRLRPHELGRRPDHRADHADPDAVDAEDRRGLQPVRRPAGRLLDDVRREEREVGPLLVGQDALDAEVELVVAEARGVEAPRVLDVDRRHVLEQRRVRRRRADVVAGRQQQRPPGERGGLLVEHRRQLAAPPTPTSRPSIGVVVGSSWPWKSFSPMIDTGLYLRPSSSRSRRTTPWLCCGAGMSSRNAAVGARSMLRTSSTTPRSIAVPPARNVARMFVLLSRSCTSGT